MILLREEDPRTKTFGPFNIVLTTPHNHVANFSEALLKKCINVCRDKLVNKSVREAVRKKFHCMVIFHNLMDGTNMFYDIRDIRVIQRLKNMKYLC